MATRAPFLGLGCLSAHASRVPGEHAGPSTAGAGGLAAGAGGSGVCRRGQRAYPTTLLGQQYARRPQPHGGPRVHRQLS